MKTYLFTYCLALLLALAGTPLVILLARSRNWVDIPNIRSLHRRSVARLGGVAIFAATVLSLLPVLFIKNAVGLAFRDQIVPILTILAGGVMMFALGVYDDLHGSRARTKLAVQMIAAVGLCAAGVHVRTVTVPGLGSIDLGMWGILVTIVWLVGITNAVNLIDGLDGLAAGISAIACGVIAVLAVLEGNVILAILMLAMLGALTGFLCFNFNPARIFMGDSGSLFLGFMIAGASVLTASKTEALFGIALPILVLGVPIFDTFFSMLRRFLQRRGIMSPDCDHFHHYLMDRGFSQYHVALIAYAVTLLITGLGFFLLIVHSAASMAIFLSCLVLLLLIFRIAGAVRLRETLSGVQHRMDISHQQQAERKNFDEIQLHFRNAQTFDQWWEAICLTADRLKFYQLILNLVNRDGSRRTLRWTFDGERAKKLIEMKLPIPDRRSGSAMNIEVHVPLDGSLESVGRRITYLTRLMEEHGLHSLPHIQEEQNR